MKSLEYKSCKEAFKSSCYYCCYKCTKWINSEKNSSHCASNEALIKACVPGVTVFHAGTRRNYDGELLTNGGRVLNVVAKGDSFEEARERAYEACDLINFEGKMFRHDIGKKALQGRSAWDE